MPIEKIEMINFRNHKNMVVDFSPGINIIWGENGSGKTSILEAVYILSNGKSFKTNKLTEAIKNGSTETTIRAHFCLLYTSPSPRDRTRSRMPSSA